MAASGPDSSTGLLSRLRAPPTTRRIVFGCLLVAFLAPGAIGAVTHDISDGTTTGPVDADRVTFVSTQGTSTQTGAGVYAVDTETKAVHWS